jgi:hypothetical protein
MRRSIHHSATCAVSMSAFPEWRIRTGPLFWTPWNSLTCVPCSRDKTFLQQFSNLSCSWPKQVQRQD